LDLIDEFHSEHGYSPGGKLCPTGEVEETSELRRIRDARRRVWQDDPKLERLVDLLTHKLRHTDTPCAVACEGCRAKRLKPAQAVALREVYEQRGGILPLRVGAGKTLVGMLIPTVLNARKPLLIVPASMKQDTLRYHAEYSRHWKTKRIEVVSYEFLSHPKHVNWLQEYAPDLIVGDESHGMAPGTKVLRRVSKYRRAAGSACTMVTMTGSIGGRSVRSYWGYSHLSLPGSAPLPKGFLEAQTWGMALDEKVLEELRVEPGALLQLGEYPPEAEPLVQARRAYQDRFTSTPGVVSTLEDIPAAKLRIWTTLLPLPAKLQADIAEMRLNYVTPGGEDFSSRLELFRHSTTLGAGLYSIWKPQAPKPWALCRREWKRFSREFLRTTPKWDSDVHTAMLIDAGRLDDGGVLAAWREIEPTFIPNPVPVWCDDTAVNYAADWLSRERGIVWVAQAEAGRRLEEMTGMPYFGRKAQDSQGRGVADHNGPMICSMQSCSVGKNLHYYNHKNLLLTVPPTNKRLEQLIGRTHRDGQSSDEVTVEILLTTRESFLALAQCVRDAEFNWATHGQPQKICYGQRNLGPVEDLLINPDMEISAP